MEGESSGRWEQVGNKEGSLCVSYSDTAIMSNLF